MAVNAIYSSAAAAYQDNTASAVTATPVSAAPETPVSEPAKVEKSAPDAEISGRQMSGKRASEDAKNQEKVPNGLDRKSAQDEIIRKAVEKVNEKTNTEAIFGIHDETNRVTIKIINKESKEVIKEFPPEKTLDMIAKVWKLAGLFVDEKR